MIDFIHIIPEIEPEINKFKVHFATGRKDNNPLNFFFRDDFKNWQEWQNQKNFEREYILSFIYYAPDQWLFAGIYKSLSCKYVEDHYQYETKLLEIGADLIGRLIIQFKKGFRASYLRLEKHYQNFRISEILKERIAIQKFPGFENVNIGFDYLKSIISKSETTWKTALENVKGVYLICDRKNGKQYVGSAYGEDAFWSRWVQYISNGHGGNIELKQLLEQKGEAYAKNFQFSILEVRAYTTSDDEIIARENHWKKVLLSKEYGYNKN